MTTISTMSSLRCEALVDALTAEFGSMFAELILESEAVDFLWEARVAERYLGQHFELIGDDDERGSELARMLVLSRVAGRWTVAMCLVDGDQSPVQLLWKRDDFGSREEAEFAFERAR